MIYLITTIHVIVCLFLIIVVLLQSGQSADIAAAFGGGMGSQTAFGARAAGNILTKATTWAAIVFMLTSITLSIFASRHGGSGSVLEGTKSAPVKTAPAHQKPAPEPQPMTPSR